MKFAQVILVDGYVIEWDANAEVCSRGMYTIKKKDAYKRSWHFSCEFSHALEILASLIVGEQKDLETKLFMIELKMNELLPKLPWEWQQKHKPYYELKTWKK